MVLGHAAYGRQTVPMQAASADLAAREARVRAAEEQLGALRTQVGQQKAAADSRQASLETQSVELQVRRVDPLATMELLSVSAGVQRLVATRTAPGSVCCHVDLFLLRE